MRATCLMAALVAVAAWSGCAIADPADPPAGALSCSGCHAARAGVVTPVPRLAGRKAADIAAHMHAFKTGRRPATVMDRIARGLTDAEIAAIAAWYAQQN